MRIDAHHHVWRLGTRPHAWLDDAGMAAVRRDFTLADLAPLTAAARIDRTILVQVLPSPAETAEFLTLAGEPGPVAGVVGWAARWHATPGRRSPFPARSAGCLCRILPPRAPT